MNMFSLLSRRGAVAVCVLLSACAASGPVGAPDPKPGDQAYGAFLAARYADTQNQPAVATKYYDEALRADPGNPELIGEGFMAALLAGSPSAEVLAAQVPNNGLSMMLEGNQAAISGDFGRASRLFAQLPQDELSELVKPLLVAWAQVGQGDTEAALAGLRPSFNKGTFGGVYVLNAALIADAAHDDRQAGQLYASVSASQPNLRLAEILASWQARQGEPAQAESELSALVQAHPDLRIALPQLQAQMMKPVINTPAQGMAEAYLTLAGALGQPSQSFLRVTFLRFALQLRPDLTAARLLLANTQAGGEDADATPSRAEMEDALATLQPIATGDPLYGPAVLQEANLLATLGRPQAAVTLLDGLIALVPGDLDLLQTAGDVWRDANQPGKAIGYYDRAIAALGNPAPEAAWTLFFDRGICEDQVGNWPAAQADILHALALSPNQPYVLNYLGYSWALRGQNLDKTHAMLQEAAGLDPNDGAVIDSLGYVDMRQGHTKEAVALLIQAVELDPDEPEVNAHLGDAFWQAGEKLQADYQWRRALALHPDAKLAAELNDKLRRFEAP
jgi:tetratricopeptide (TPR) repeat protein